MWPEPSALAENRHSHETVCLHHRKANCSEAEKIRCIAGLVDISLEDISPRGDPMAPACSSYIVGLRGYFLVKEGPAHLGAKFG